MAKKEPPRPAYGRLHVRVTLDTAGRLDGARAALKRRGMPVSASSFVEVALLELLARNDLAEVLRKRGASARRV